MRYLPFILRNLKRKKTRTILTVGSIAVALFLFGLWLLRLGAAHSGWTVNAAIHAWHVARRDVADEACTFQV